MDDHNQAYPTNNGVEMLGEVLRDALFDLIRLKAFPMRREEYLELRERLAAELLKYANQGEKCPKTLRQHVVLSGFLASIEIIDHPKAAHGIATRSV